MCVLKLKLHRHLLLFKAILTSHSLVVRAQRLLEFIPQSLQWAQWTEASAYWVMLPSAKWQATTKKWKSEAKTEVLKNGYIEGREVIGPRRYVFAQTACEQVTCTSHLQVRISESKACRTLSNMNTGKRLPLMFIDCFILHSYEIRLLWIWLNHDNMTVRCTFNNSS